MSEFYPLFLSFQQSKIASLNRFVGPVRVSPIYQIVVAINVDTLYASTFVDLTKQPVVITIPSTSVNYSVLTLDAFGDIFESGIVSNAPGTYALTGPGFNGKLPVGVTPLPVPVNFFNLIVRADRFSPTNQDQTDQADLFRRSLKAQTLSNYLKDPSGGRALIVPEIFFAVPVKTAADELVARDPITFLTQLQQAVASSNTPPLTEQQAQLSKAFDTFFSRSGLKPVMAAATQAAHELIIQKYEGHTGRTNWIGFNDIGAWGDRVVERSSIAEFIQWGNGRRTAGYYQTFKDSNGNALDGRNSKVYVLTFAADQIPPALRFWSITAYTPETIELIQNPLKKYAVASYTPDLVTNQDGSVSIYISREQPAGVPQANWLPVSDRPFNIMLRCYGSEGTVSAGTYVPPAVERVQ
ncbi:MAG TPA: DUF1214 domain-containing protein [Candidatus Binataceae bacterium]|nr:DUF1214 domain-containing protein [Candidatus Binataceae bacterium]